MSDASRALDEFKRLLAEAPQGIGGGVELLLQELSPQAAEMLRLVAIPHQFDAELLRVLDPTLPPENVAAVYDELVNLSIAIEAGECFAIHDNARAYLLNQWFQPQRRAAFAAVSQRLATHFARVEAQATGAAKIAAQRARIFHLLGSDLQSGFAAFDDLCRAEHLRFRVHSCEALIQLAREYEPILSVAQKRWLSFHEARLLLDMRRYGEAEALLVKLQQEVRDDMALRARILFRLGCLRQIQRRLHEAQIAFSEGLMIARSRPEARNQELRLVQNLAALHTEMNELNRAATLLHEAIKMAERAGDRAELAACHNSLGILQRKLSEPDRAIESFQRSLLHLDSAEDEYRTAQVHNNLGLAHADQAHWDEARQAMETGLEIARRFGDTNGQAVALSNLGRVYLGLNRRADAIRAADQAVELFVQAQNWFGAGATTEGIGRFYRREGRLPQARDAFIQAAAYFRRVPDTAAAARCDNAADPKPARRSRRWLLYAIVAGLAIFLLLFLALILEELE